jgi:hypothetical protein
MSRVSDWPAGVSVLRYMILPEMVDPPHRGQSGDKPVERFDEYTLGDDYAFDKTVAPVD